MKRLVIASALLLAAAALPEAAGRPEVRRAATVTAGSDLYAEGEANGFGATNYAEGENNGFGAKNFAMASLDRPVYHSGPFVVDQWLD